MMEFRLVKTQENGDATCNYDVILPQPVPLKDLLMSLIHHDEREFFIRIDLWPFDHSASHGMELHRHKEDNSWYIESGVEWYLKMKNCLVESCWANGGYGQMGYHLTFQTDAFGKYVYV